MKAKKIFSVVIPVYDGVDLVDIAAPREVFISANNDEQEFAVHYVGEGVEGHQHALAQGDQTATTSLKIVTTRGGLRFYPDRAFDDPAIQEADLVWVPGGAPDALRRMLDEPDSDFFNYIKKIGAKSTYVTSVCEGAILLAATGLLDGYEATTHHSFMACLKAFPKVIVVEEGYPRYVKDRNRVTGAGISSGLDEALFLVELIQGTATAMAAQSVIQYYPEPPVMGTIVPSDTCPVEGLWPAENVSDAAKISHKTGAGVRGGYR